MASNFTILYVMVVMTFWCCILILAVQLLPVLKSVDYGCIVRDINKSEAIHLSENFALEDRGYICLPMLKIYSTTILTIQ